MERQAFTSRGKRLEYFTIGWNLLEGLIAMAAGVVAGSTSLLGFGIDSVIEVTSGGALLWRMFVDEDVNSRAHNEKLTLRIVGGCFLALAVYLLFESVSDLWHRRAAEHSVIGIVVAIASLIVMPLLSRAKRRLANQLGSPAMVADAKQTDICAFLSAILLAGLALNSLFGLWWADPLAALVMVPLIAREGIEGVRGEACACG